MKGKLGNPITRPVLAAGFFVGHTPNLAAILSACIAAQGLETNPLGSAVAATRELAAMVGIGMHNRRDHPSHAYRR